MPDDADYAAPIRQHLLDIPATFHEFICREGLDQEVGKYNDIPDLSDA